jgi:hypothetical protein
MIMTLAICLVLLACPLLALLTGKEEARQRERRRERDLDMKR